MATESAKQKPQLLAFLICEKVVLDEEIPIIWRVIDTFNFVLALPETIAQEVREQLNVQLRCEVFTRWGPEGEGEHKIELALKVPNGKEVSRDSQTFQMAGEHGFVQVMWNIELGLATEGMYNWVLYLDGDEVARHPFKVNITRQAQTPEAK